MRIRAVEDNPARFILIEAEVDERADEIARLRIPLSDRPFHLLRHRVRIADVVFLGVAQERVEIARGREPDAKDQRVFRCVNHNVFGSWIEAVFQTDLRRIGRARKRRCFAIGKGPVRGRHSSLVRGLRCPAQQLRF